MCESYAEEWRPVVGYEGFYEVSSHGRLKSVPRTKRFKERILKGGVTRFGYRRMLLCVKKPEKVFLPASLSC